MKLYRFRVVLDTKEDVFRDVEITSDQHFETFYDAIVKAFGFNGGVMSSFYMSNENWDKGPEITLLDMSEKGEEENVMNKCLLEEYMVEERQRIILVYDFMRMWCFLVELIETEEINSNTGYPKVTLSFGKAPKEESKEMSDVPFEEMQIGAEHQNDGDEEDIEDEIGGMFDDYNEYEDQ